MLKTFRDKREKKLKEKQKIKESRKYKGILVIPEFDFDTKAMQKVKKQRFKKIIPKKLLRQQDEYKVEMKQKKKDII